ncbi:MAG: serine/threonine-protein kinase, partial [Gemmataceae bacterium]|nr:serine/threonine-protein kinase [Gemmataceae bacterium]
MAGAESLVDPVAELAEEFMARYRRGERPALSEYTQKHPELAERIRQVFPMMVLMEEAAPLEVASTKATEFEPASAGLRLGEKPEHVGGYRILREIGRGGMGIVYEAEQVALGRHVAIKVLPLPAARQGKGLERFRREARAAARLHHTNIVPVYEVGEEKEICYYAMQYIDGQPLDQVLEELRRFRNVSDQGDPHVTRADGPASPTIAQSLWAGRPDRASFVLSRQHNSAPPANATGLDPICSSDTPLLPDRQECPSNDPVVKSESAVNNGTATTAVLPGDTDVAVAESNRQHYFRSVAWLGIQVAEALAFAHHEGVLHRDIKPSNLLLDAQGRVWVTDFGLAKTEGETLTCTGDLLGTFRYMAPERFRGWSDPRSDVYSLGLTLYEMLALVPAFAETDQARLMHQITHVEPPRLRKVDRQVPPDLATIVTKAIDKEPGRRYQSAGELAADLQRFVEDRPILARQTGMVERTWRWCRRNPAVAALLLTVALTLLGGMGFSTLFALRASDRAEQEAKARADEEKERNRAEQEWKRAETQLLHARTAQYGRTLDLMQRCLAENDPAHAEYLLEQCPADLQGWEYNHFREQVAGRVQTFAIHSDNVAGVAFHPDGELVASISWDGCVCLWDRATGRQRRRLEGHTFRQNEKRSGAVLVGLAKGGLSFSRDGTRLASFSTDQVIVWDVPTGQVMWMRDCDPRHSFAAMAFHSDGRHIAVWDWRITVWDLETGRATLTLPAPQRAHGNCLAFSPDGSRLVAGASSKVLVWELATGRQVLELIPKNRFPSQILFSPDSKQLAVDDELLDAETGQVMRTAIPLDGKTLGKKAQFSPDLRFLVAMSAQYFPKEVIVRNAETGQTELLFRTESPPSCLEFCPDGRHLVTGHQDGLIRLWNLAPRTPATRTTQPVKKLKGLWSPDGQWAATREPGQITLRELETGRALHTLPMRLPDGQPG